MSDVEVRLPESSKLACLALALASIASGCSPSPRLASGPIDLGPSPTLVRFERSVPAAGTDWELCFEFDLQRDSFAADRIHAVLLASSGERHALTETELDRRGERDVCQLGRIPVAQPTAYEAVELSSEIPLRLRGLRGGSRR